MGILIDNRQSRHKISIEKTRKKAQVILNALECPDGELSVVTVDDAMITALNTEYFNRPRPTNVISFPMQEGAFTEINPDLLGDVVISLDTAFRESENAGLEFEERFDQLLVHGILHLFGYDHEDDLAEAEKMEQKSIAILKIIKQ
jgi:probable rRNA maturation factor